MRRLNATPQGEPQCNATQTDNGSKKENVWSHAPSGCTEPAMTARWSVSACKAAASTASTTTAEACHSTRVAEGGGIESVCMYMCV